MRPTLIEQNMDSREQAELIINHLTNIGTLLYSKFQGNLKKAFEFFDKNDDGRLTIEEVIYYKL